VNTEGEAERVERLRLQGVVRSGFDGMDVESPGGKFNLTDINATIGLHQLQGLDEITRRRAELAELYFAAAERSGLASLGIELPERLSTEGARTNWHMFQVLLPSERLQGGRAAVMKEMRAANIGTGVHYPAVHLFSFYRSQGWRPGMLPNAERVGRSILTLPLFPAMSDADVERVCASLAATCRSLLS
jgi:Predicted pyridoxal phosphate-dependent enzyme apparently involved in regulation of cell wall biogenesis